MMLLRAVVLCACLALSGCGGNQSAWAPAGPQAGRLHDLLWLFLVVSAGVYFLALVFVAIPSIRRRYQSGENVSPDTHPDPKQERAFEWWVGGAILATTVILFVLMAGDFYTGEKLHALAEGKPLRIKVTGYQWWWLVEYQDDIPSNHFFTSNELHLPVGKPVQLELVSNDVIHSFWVPNLHGKRDLIPGHPTKTYLQADTPGVYLGQCAEFCGLEHAFMRLTVTAESPEDYERWAAAQRGPALEPQTDRQKQGRAVFLGTSCIMCHTISGTMARAQLGPDLSHIGSRPLIAGKLENRREHLSAWILNPQAIKPGVRMPAHALHEDQLEPLLDYLGMLK